MEESQLCLDPQRTREATRALPGGVKGSRGHGAPEWDKARVSCPFQTVVPPPPSLLKNAMIFKVRICRGYFPKGACLLQEATPSWRGTGHGATVGHAWRRRIWTFLRPDWGIDCDGCCGQWCSLVCAFFVFHPCYDTLLLDANRLSSQPFWTL